MASITDCVVEGLKYPFNDIKKLLGLGILFVIFDLISMCFTLKTVDVTRMIVDTLEKTNATASTLSYSQLPNGDIYLAIAILIVGFLVSLFIMGYQYKVISFSINRKDDLPGFGDIVGMFIKGVKYFLVSIVYAIPSMIVAFLAILVTNNSSLWPVIMIISVLLMVVSYFILIMALNNMVAHDSIKKAFDFSEIIGNISNLGWGKYIGTVIFTVIVFMIINMTIGIVMSFLTVIFAATVNNQAIVISTVISIIEALFVTSCASQGVTMHYEAGSNKNGVIEESEAGDETEDDQHPVFGGQSAQEASDAVDQKRIEDDGAPSQSVGDGPGEGGANHHSEDSGARQPAELVLGKVPVGADGGDDPADHALVHGVEHPSHTHQH